MFSILKYKVFLLAVANGNLKQLMDALIENKLIKDVTIVCEENMKADDELDAMEVNISNEV